MSFPTTPILTTGELVEAADWNAIVADLALLKTSIADDGRLSGEILAFREEVTTLSIVSGVITLNLAASNNFKVSLTANITSIVVTGWTASKDATVKLRLTQDGTGGRTVAWPAGWHWASNAPPVMTATANKTDIALLSSDDGGTTPFAALFTQNA